MGFKKSPKRHRRDARPDLHDLLQDGGLGMHGECMPAGQEFGPGVEDKFGDKVAHAASGQETTSRVIVCNAAHTHASISMFYPPQLASFFTDKALLKAFEHDGFLGSKLGADVGEIRFLEWRQSSV